MSFEGASGDILVNSEPNERQQDRILTRSEVKDRLAQIPEIAKIIDEPRLTSDQKRLVFCEALIIGGNLTEQDLALADEKYMWGMLGYAGASMVGFTGLLALISVFPPAAFAVGVGGMACFGNALIRVSEPQPRRSPAKLKIAVKNKFKLG